MKNEQRQTIPYDITPELALQELKEGNFRFMNNLRKNRDLLQQVNETKDGQWPFAAILSCMDSRTSAELIFDQGLGDIFSVRIAGNIISEGILGSLEYATAVAGSKLILVLGHTNCGAIKGACDHVKMGNLTSLIERILPAVAQETTFTENRNSKNAPFVDAVAELNVKNGVKEILEKSEVIRNLVEQEKVSIAAAVYNVSTGKVNFLETEIIEMAVPFNDGSEAA
ncbi:carbonic anhydrase family protein [Taibaiella soli]|uniref:Carbonic anhydrase n=1 Tax=Taibaiella soli TaxID=1649169 RepID=A0A2W2AWC0_9BACT|nr:carbonic anhydrase family protein [Taibaiella soli]PZF71988.1 carbonic anhydrase [Taibaiella soli]